MTTPDLEVLAALTRDYAAFQSRKSGLATALGGALVLLLFWIAVLPQVFGIWLLQRPALEWTLLAPFLWLALKELLARRLYQSLGTVKPPPDAAYERRRWFWIFGLALFLMTCLAVATYGFVSGALMAAKPWVKGLPEGHPLDHPWPWLIWMPLLYLLPAPWVLRGTEEARAYAVLVGQCLLWMIPAFLFGYGAFPPIRPLSKAAGILAPLGLVTLIIGIAVWAALAMVRGWKEHREYLALLRALPREA